MRKASRILGLIGSCLALSFSVSILYGAFRFFYPPFSSPETAGVLLGVGTTSAVSGALGFIGGARLKGNNRKAGMLMLAAAFLTMPTVIPCILLLLGGLFALVRLKPPVLRNAGPVWGAPQSRPPQVDPQYCWPPAYPPNGYPPQGIPPQGWPCPPPINDTQINDPNKEGQ